jgi:DNA (cytosine-5)-methyltransferase 1
MSQTTTKRAAEFFAGIGLVRMALERAGWEVKFANDIDPRKLAMYRSNFGADDFYLGDIRDVCARGLPSVDLATASFPCIDLSLAGNRGGLNGSHSSAYWEFHRIMAEAGARRPRFVLLENVVGLLSSNEGRDLRSIIQSLGALGYGCDLLLVDAVHFVPQSRPRLFIVGCLDDRSQWPICPDHETRPPAVTGFIQRNRDLNWAHADLPPLPPKRAGLRDLLERLRDDDPMWWDRQRKDHLLEQMSAAHKRLLQYLQGQKAIEFATVYKRVRPSGCRAELRADGIAGCLRTPRGGSSKQFVIQAGRGGWRVRNMTPRECARLQGVPDSFRIDVPYTQALLGFGDAVCVPAVEWVVRHAVESRKDTARTGQRECHPLPSPTRSTDPRPFDSALDGPPFPRPLLSC